MLLRYRIKRWYRWAKARGIPLTRILIHPRDAWQAPARYKGLPVEVMGARQIPQ